MRPAGFTGILVAAGLATAFVTADTARVQAWEEDVHASLTCWLARRAGFNEHDAARVAKADQDFDDSQHHAAIGMMVRLMVTGDLGIARDLQAKHFPSAVDLPNLPQLRVVVPNSPAARRLLDGVVASKGGTNDLIPLGEALHPFQDSWSHQGIPDCPFGFRSAMGVGHPVSRGGWRSHDADLTPLHVAEVVTMARETFVALERFLANNPGVREVGARRWTWAELEPDVRLFAVAASTAEKNAWIERQSTLALAQPITAARPPRTPKRVIVVPAPQLRQGTLRQPSPMLVSLGSAPAMAQDGNAAPEALVGAANRLLKDWFVGQATSRTAEEMVQWRRLTADDYALNGLPDRMESLALLEWWQRLLTMYLVDDHAVINALGHCDVRHAGYKEMPVDPPREGRLAASSSIEIPAVRSADFVHMASSPIDGRPYRPGADAFMLPIQISALRHDAMVLVWRRSATSEWKLTALIQVVL